MKASLGSSLIVLLAFWSEGVGAAGDEEDVLVDNISNIPWTDTVRKRYYCTFRNLWTKERQPAQYPLNGRWSAPFMYTHTLEFESWSRGAETTAGIEKYAETGFSDVLIEEMANAGDLTFSYAEPIQGFFTQSADHINIPPFDVNGGYPYLTTIAAMIPSPDWFTGFYDFWLVEENSRMWFDHLLIQTYPWDAGTDSGDAYDSVESDLLFQDPVTKFERKSAPSGEIFLGPDLSTVPPVAEWECFLHLGEADLILPDCDYFKDPCCNATEEEECTDTGILGFGETPSDRSDWYEATSGASWNSVLSGFLLMGGVIQFLLF